MTDSLVFNHHSLPFPHRQHAENAIPDFLKICVKAKNAGLRTILVAETTDHTWFRLELAPGYFWQDWHNTHLEGEHRDVIRAFRSIATQSPLFNSDDIDAGADLFEVSLDGRGDYTAIRAAAWHESPLVSFPATRPWNVSPLTVKICMMNLETEELEHKTIEIPNFHSYTVLESYLPELFRQRDVAISSGRDIVTQFESLYPGLMLCGKAATQLNRWSASSTILNQVKRSLLSLNKFALEWQEDKISYYSVNLLHKIGLPFRVSGESETVCNNPVLKREREFWLPNGRKEFFEQHIKMNAGYRLHFYPDNNTREIYVGYIGPHLKLK